MKWAWSAAALGLWACGQVEQPPTEVGQEGSGQELVAKDDGSRFRAWADLYRAGGSVQRLAASLTGLKADERVEFSSLRAYYDRCFLPWEAETSPQCGIGNRAPWTFGATDSKAAITPFPGSRNSWSVLVDVAGSDLSRAQDDQHFTALLEPLAFDLNVVKRTDGALVAECSVTTVFIATANVTLNRVSGQAEPTTFKMQLTGLNGDDEAKSITSVRFNGVPMGAMPLGDIVDSTFDFGNVSMWGGGCHFGLCYGELRTHPEYGYQFLDGTADTTSLLALFQQGGELSVTLSDGSVFKGPVKLSLQVGDLRVRCTEK